MKRGILVLIIVYIILIYPPIITTSTTTSKDHECQDLYISNPDSEHALDITFLSEGRDIEDVEKQLKNLVKTMEKIEPFNEFIDEKINIRYVTPAASDFDCCSDLFAFCNQAELIKLVSTCPTDEIVVFSSARDRGRETCSSYRGVAALGQHAVIFKEPDGTEETSKVILHELGHSLAFLGDEYVYKNVFGEGREEEYLKILENQLTFFNYPNCERNPVCKKNEEGEKICKCTKWANIPGTGCYKDCSSPDWYRETDYDMMRSSQAKEFGPVDKRQFRSAINRYVDYVEEPISIEVNKKLEDLIVRKFLEKNKEITGTIPDIKYEEKLRTKGWPDYIRWILLPTSLGIIDFNCRNFRIASKTDPKVIIRFNDINIEHIDEVDSVYVTLDIDVSVRGASVVKADGKIRLIGFIEISCDNVLEDYPITWNSRGWINMIIKARLHYDVDELNTIVVDPYVNRPKIKNPINFHVNVHNMQNDLEKELIDILSENAFDPSERFVTKVNGITSRINQNLDEFGLALKTSLDMLGLEELPYTGKPNAMILDIYPNDDTGIDIKSDRLRIWGDASMNKPYTGFKAECVKGYDHKFQAIDVSEFKKEINTEKYGAIRISESFVNWFIANLWNEGFFCSERRVEIANLPDFFQDNEELDLSSYKYTLTPKNPPYINYNEIIDIENDFHVKGDSNVEFEFYFDDNTIKANADLSYYIPLVLEEPDATLPAEQAFSFAQSFFRSDTDKVEIILKEFNCEGNAEKCGIISSTKNKELLLKEIKEEIISHINRAFSEIPINPVRDINLNFGEVGIDYFTPGINLNFGEYTAKVDLRDIKNKYLTYEFDLIEKCKEECKAPSNALITKVEEKFVKNREECLKEPTSESRGCINQLIAQPGQLYHYYIVYYISQAPYITYNFNLRSWNSYKYGSNIIRKIYLASDSATFDALKNNELEYIDEFSTIHKFTNDCTQIIVVRSKSDNGIEQDFECMSSVIFDQCTEQFSYYAQPVFATIKPRFRNEVKDAYGVCTKASNPELYKLQKEYPEASPSPVF